VHTAEFDGTGQRAKGKEQNLKIKDKSKKTKTMTKNVIVAQSGGPSPVINSSLRGIIETCMMFPDKFGKVYGGWHGIEES